MPGTRKLPPVKRVALLYGQRPLNKGSTKVLMFPFATPSKHGVFKVNNKLPINHTNITEVIEILTQNERISVGKRISAL